MFSFFVRYAGLLELAVAANEVVGGRVVLQGRIPRGFDLGNDVLCQHFAQFHTPLIEGVDMPDCSLGKYRVLIEGYEFTQRFWSKFLRQQDVGWTIALEYTMRHQANPAFPPP